MSSSTDASAYYVDHGIQSDYLQFQYGKAGTSATNLTTAPVLRDVSGWYHVLFAVDLTQATASNRVRIYLNGVQLTVTGTQPTQNDTTWKFNQNSIVHYIAGENSAGSTTTNFDGYMAEYNFIDGYPTVSGTTYNATTWAALNVATLFTSYDTNGILQPARYTGTYGNNGFYLPFSNTTSTTTLCSDSSGNGNNWTPANISLSAGATYDSMIDSPTNYADGTSYGRGSYCVLNRLSNTAGTFSNANLQYVGPSSWRRANGSISLSSDKWYWEVTIGTAPFTPRGTTGCYNAFGFGLATVFDSTTGAAAVTDAVIFGDNGYYKNFSGAWTDSGFTISNGDVLAVAVDLGANTFAFYQNNVSRVTGTIGTTAGTLLVPVIVSYDGTYGLMNSNFGQRPFVYTPPSGYSPINTQNLSSPSILNGAPYMAAVTYTGNGNANGDTQSIVTSTTNSGNNPLGITFQPDFVWTKDRISAGTTSYDYHLLDDSVRGAGSDINSNVNAAEYAGNQISAFNAAGFTARRNTTYNQNNVNGITYVAWEWVAGGAPTVNNTAGASNVPTAGSVLINGSNSTSALAGTIAATRISANQSAGFSIVTYTGNGTLGATVGHCLNATPSMIMFKNRSSIIDWAVYHISIGNTTAVSLNSSNPSYSPSTAYFNNTSPNATTFTIGNGTTVNTASSNYVAYCFAPISGYSAFGSYVGNGNASGDGPFIYTNFRPRYLLIKSSTQATSNWVVIDSSRNTYNVVNNYLIPSTYDIEAQYNIVDFCSNGFKIKALNGTITNNSGDTYVYMCFAENPFKIARAR